MGGGTRCQSRQCFGTGLAQSKNILISIVINYFKDFSKREKRDVLVTISLTEN